MNATDTVAPIRPAAATFDIDALAPHLTLTRRRLRAGQHLYRAGQPMRALYFVHAGFLRTSVAADDGREQVTGFPMRGDLVGVDAVGVATHPGDAIALDTCEIVELSYPAVLHACAVVPSLHGMLAVAVGAELRRDRARLLALATLSAEQRVAWFLRELALRQRALGYSAHHLCLRMSRIDIGNHLALKHETVTRALSHLDAEGVIAVDRREVRIACLERLAAAAGVGAAAAARVA